MTPAAGPPERRTAALLRLWVAEWVRLAARRPTAIPSVDSVDSVDRADRDPSHAPAASASEARLLFVDGFARSGLAGTGALVSAGTAAPGAERAVEAVRALFAAAEAESTRQHPVDARAVLIEEDPAHLAALRGALVDAGLGERIRETGDPASVRHGEVGLVEADFAAVAPGLAALLTAAPAQSLVHLAPPAAKRLPWPAVHALAALPDADLLIAFPHADLHRQARFGALPFADLPPHPRRAVEGISALLGDARHGWLAEWRAAEREQGPAAAELRMVRGYGDRLVEVAGGRTVKRLRLAEAGRDETLLHLFLLTADPARALALNAAVLGSGLEDRAPGDRGRAAPLVPLPEEAAPAVLELFAPAEMRGGAAEPPRAERQVDAAAVAELLAGRFAGRSVRYRDVLASLTDTDLPPAGLRRALSLLKRSGRAVYRSLADDDAEVAFPSSPIPPAAKRKRAPSRAAAPLFDAVEEEPSEAEDKEG